MAQKEIAKQTKAKKKKLAEELFKNQYKKYITKKLLEELAISYLTEDSIQNWQEKLAYNEELELNLLWWTHMFIVLLSDTNQKINMYYKSPVFLRNFIGLVSGYLSKYIHKKGVRQNECRQDIRNTLLNKDIYTQIAIKKYINAINQEYAWQQKRKNIALEQQRKRKRLNGTGTIQIRTTEKNETKSVKARIKEKKQELNKQPVSYTAEQEARFHAKIAAVKAEQFRNRAVFKLEVVVNGIESR